MSRARWLWLAAALALAPAAGADGDRVEIRANSAHYDDEADAFLFFGDVTATGTGLRLVAERLEVGGGEQNPVYVSSGSPTLLDLTADDGQVVRARGARITMDLTGRRMTVSGGTLRIEGQSVAAEEIRFRARDSRLDAAGSVRFVQENLDVRGDRLLAGGGDAADIEVVGSPTTVTGMEDNAGFEATAATLRVDPGDSGIRLIGAAKARNSDGEIAGETIFYNPDDNTFVAVAGERERVLMIMGGDNDPDGEAVPPGTVPGAER